mmetsp:Transcript_56620/g.89935  ORF Transcript_56620/g.89935 Transcript_56620/m.89935 type:complete len:139 (+) Transcript_56620:246-662(+)
MRFLAYGNVGIWAWVPLYGSCDKTHVAALLPAASFAGARLVLFLLLGFLRSWDSSRLDGFLDCLAVMVYMSGIWCNKLDRLATHQARADADHLNAWSFSFVEPRLANATSGAVEEFLCHSRMTRVSSPLVRPRRLLLI